MDVLHGCKLSRCHALEIGGGDVGHWEGEDIDVGVAENVSIDGHRQEGGLTVNGAACTKQCCVCAEVVVVPWAMMWKAGLVAFRYLGVEIAGFRGVFVSGEGELKDVVSDLARYFEEWRGGLGVFSDLAWYFEEWRGGLGVCRKCLLWSQLACFFSARSERSTRCFGRIGADSRLNPVSCGCFCPDHGCIDDGRANVGCNLHCVLLIGTGPAVHVELCNISVGLACLVVARHPRQGAAKSSLEASI